MGKYDTITLGFCPIGKFVFSHEDALFFKRKIETAMDGMGVRYVGIDSVVKDGIVRSQADVDPVVEHLTAQKADCLFIPHCNFGTESAAGMIAKKLGVPVLLWGPRDGAPLADGTRLRDTLCGMFATSRVLSMMGVPFTFIENCETENRACTDGLDIFLRAANVVKRFRNSRIGIAGNRIDFFWSTIVNENELLDRFGIELLPVDLVKIVRMTKEAARAGEKAYREESEDFGRKLDLSRTPEQAVVNALALRDTLFRFASENGLKALAVESFMSLVEELGTYISFAQSLVSDMGVPCVCESDVHGAISAIMAEAAALNGAPSFFADLTVRHPENDNGILLWHDSFPLSLKHPDCRGSLGKHWILPGDSPGMCHWKLKDGDVTIVRFDGNGRGYSLMAEEARSIPGPYTQNTYLWVELDDFKKFERKVIEGPYIHHTACVYGRCRDALEEACRYIPGLAFDS
jgi:L-fucose isomerase-like protein